MRIRRDRNGLGVAYLSRSGLFLRRTSVIDQFGSNPRPFVDIVSTYDALPYLMAEKAARTQEYGAISPLGAKLAAWRLAFRDVRSSRSGSAR